MVSLLWLIVSLHAWPSDRDDGIKHRTIQFADHTWDVRPDAGGGPGTRCWSDSMRSVWLDEAGLLHLKVRKKGQNWCQAEVRRRRPAAYGDHLFQVITSGPLLHEFDPNLVVGLFLYRDDHREIDIELTRSFGDGDLNGWHVVQRNGSDGSIRQGFSFEASGSHTSHRIRWRPDRIEFTSYHGHCDEPPCGGIIAHWEYRGSNNPRESDRLRPHLQLWVNEDGVDREQEIIIANYRETPLE